jgi:4-amino-4-deoxy-L-arabinose transferase-like glycosyltransferase
MPPHEPLLDFSALALQLRRVVPVIAALAVLGGVGELVTAGASAALAVRWVTIFVVALLATMAVLTGVHAMGGADRAQRRGERLSSDDVRLTPPPRERWKDGRPRR